MNLSLTVPQLFYDVIARLLPGSLFLLVLGLGVRGTEAEWWARPPSEEFGNGIVTLLAYLVAAYILGWSLRWLSWPNFEKKIREKLSPKEEPSMSRRYQTIRLVHPESGFRIVKLRAEARMLEAARSAMITAAICISAVWLLGQAGLLDIGKVNGTFWVFRITLPLLMVWPLIRAEKYMWGVYFGNVLHLFSHLKDRKIPET